MSLEVCSREGLESFLAAKGGPPLVGNVRAMAKVRNNLEILRLVGAAIEAHGRQLAELRIGVFHDFPYLYEGSLEYEREYLKTYWTCPESLVVLVRDQGRAVGATTAIPLRHETPEFREPLRQAGLIPEEFLYLGESILLRPYRGRGLGHVFFEERENHARALGLSKTCFCAVERPVDHPLKPADYRPLNAFWESRGYHHRSEIRTTYTWKDLDEEHPSAKPMSFWLRDLMQSS